MNSDPFKEAEFGEEEAAAAGKGRLKVDSYVHIRIQQRNGRKCVTTVQGLRKEYNCNKILKDLKKEFCCNGNVVQDAELGKVIQLQGDQRKNVSDFLNNVTFFPLSLWFFLCCFLRLRYMSCMYTSNILYSLYLTRALCDCRPVW